MLMLHKRDCGDDKITTIRTSPESQLHWRKDFHRNPLYFRKYADFEADNEIDNSKVRDHCHLTGKYIRPAHSICNINVTQKQINFIPIIIS